MANYSDNFDRANGDIGAGWVEDAGDINIVSNVAVPQDSEVFNRARYASALDSANHFVQATFGRINEVSARQASSTDTCYSARVAAYDTDPGYKLYKYVSGSETELDTALNNVTSGEIRVRLTVDGASQVMTGRIFDGGWQEDQEVCSGTDSDITTGLYAGLHGYHNFSSYDDWSAEDLAAGGLSIPVAMYHYRSQQ